MIQEHLDAQEHIWNNTGQDNIFKRGTISYTITRSMALPGPTRHLTQYAPIHQNVAVKWDYTYVATNPINLIPTINK